MVSDLVAKTDLAFLRHSCGEHPGRQPARLENDDLVFSRQPVIEQDLWDLCRFSGAGGRLENGSRMDVKRADERGLEIVNGKAFQKGIMIR